MDTTRTTPKTKGIKKAEKPENALSKIKRQRLALMQQDGQDDQRQESQAQDQNQKFLEQILKPENQPSVFSSDKKRPPNTSRIEKQLQQQEIAKRQQRLTQEQEAVQQLKAYQQESQRANQYFQSVQQMSATQNSIQPSTTLPSRNQSAVTQSSVPSFNTPRNVPNTQPTMQFEYSPTPYEELTQPGARPMKLKHYLFYNALVQAQLDISDTVMTNLLSLNGRAEDIAEFMKDILNKGKAEDFQEWNSWIPHGVQEICPPAQFLERLLEEGLFLVEPPKPKEKQIRPVQTSIKILQVVPKKQLTTTICEPKGCARKGCNDMGKTYGSGACLFCVANFRQVVNLLLVSKFQRDTNKKDKAYLIQVLQENIYIKTDNTKTQASEIIVSIGGSPYEKGKIASPQSPQKITFRFWVKPNGTFGVYKQQFYRAMCFGQESLLFLEALKSGVASLIGQWGCYIQTSEDVPALIEAKSKDRELLEASVRARSNPFKQE